MSERTQEEELQAIGFHVGEERFALPTNAIREVIASPNITRVPRAPQHITGIINLRGLIVPVLDLSARLRSRTSKPPVAPKQRPSWVVIVDHEDEILGLGVAQVSKVLRVKSSEITDVPPIFSGICEAYLSGVARLADGFLVFLNLHNLLDDDLETTA